MAVNFDLTGHEKKQNTHFANNANCESIVICDVHYFTDDAK